MMEVRGFTKRTQGKIVISEFPLSSETFMTSRAWSGEVKAVSYDMRSF
jgi:hypothetical protein